MSLLVSYLSGIVTLLFSWYYLKDLVAPVAIIFVFSSTFLYLLGPNAIAFALCLCNGWIQLNLFVEKILPISSPSE
jgi:hypothetical protein